MPWLLPDGTAVAATTTATSEYTNREYISWKDLARASGNPSWAHEAVHAQKGYYREQAQRQLLKAYNRRAAA